MITLEEQLDAVIKAHRDWTKIALEAQAQVVELAGRNTSLRHLLRDYGVWAQDGMEALTALETAVNVAIWKERYSTLQKRANELMGGQYETIA